MDRIRAPLSLKEELALRHVAGGLADHATEDTARQGHIRRLKTLGLVEEIDGALRLTIAGRDRYARLPRTGPAA